MVGRMFLRRSPEDVLEEVTTLVLYYCIRLSLFYPIAPPIYSTTLLLRQYHETTPTTVHNYSTITLYYYTTKLDLEEVLEEVPEDGWEGG